MASECSSHVLDGTSCLCCMCQCGDHKCLQQMALKLPLQMQLELESKRMQPPPEDGKRDVHEQAGLYSRTTYRTDFSEPLDIIDEFPLEQRQKGLATSVKLRSGHVAKDSTYKADFTPWSTDEQELYRGKLHVPDHLLEDGQGDRCSCVEKTCERLYDYYCPPHCLGVKEVPKVNCLSDFKEKFNIGPPKSRVEDVTDKLRQPFTKFTNYRLDYRGGAIPPRQDKKVVEVPRVHRPMERDTTYRTAYTCPPDDCFAGKKEKCNKTPQGALTTGHKPMQQDTTSMLDYTDPEVVAHKADRPPRESFFRPLNCPMETETTTATSYPRWKNQIRLSQSHQGERKSPSEPAFRMEREKDVRRLVTTYQEDFDGLNRALCPCTVVENYGPKVLEPRFCIKEPNEQHEFFGFDRNSESTSKECLHYQEDENQNKWK